MAAPPTLTIPKYVRLKNHPHIDEKWLHDRLNPELLGLGELIAQSIRTQTGTGQAHSIA